MEYDAALEEKSNSQAKRIIEPEDSVDGQTVLSKETYFAASAAETGGANKELQEIWEMMKKLTASVTTQDATFVSLSTKTNSGGGSGQNTNKNKSKPGLHVCTQYKREV